jgi:hypothetical protein
MRLSRIFPLLAALFFAIAISVSATEPDPLPDSTRIRIVFPFEVGQEYEFKSAWTFHHPNGDTLPPDSVARITIRDTVISGQTWLHIPYWTPFGTEYYRLDDSLRVWNFDVATGDSLVLLHFGETEIDSLTYVFGLLHCDGPGVMDIITSYPLEWDIPPQDSVFFRDHTPYWAYKSVPQYGYPEYFGSGDPMDSRCFESGGEDCPFGDRERSFATGWCLGCGDPQFGYSFRQIRGTCGTFNPIISVNHSASAIEHRFGQSFCSDYYFLWAVFRRASDIPWPELTDIPYDWVGIKDNAAHPTPIHISTHPNPFNPSVTITYSLPNDGPFRLEIRTVTGQLVRVLVDEHRPAGDGRVVWDGKNAMGRDVASGTYVCRLRTVSGSVTRRVTLVR